MAKKEGVRCGVLQAEPQTSPSIFWVELLVNGNPTTKPTKQLTSEGTGWLGANKYLLAQRALLEISLPKLAPICMEFDRRPPKPPITCPDVVPSHCLHGQHFHHAIILRLDASARTALHRSKVARWVCLNKGMPEYGGFALGFHLKQPATDKNSNNPYTHKPRFLHRVAQGALCPQVVAWQKERMQLFT